MKVNTFNKKGIICDVVRKEFYSGIVHVEKGIITKIERQSHNEKQYILPGLIDAHVHIESSMLVPSEFARIALRHGTTSTISDPHEIANVAGIDGVNFMIENGNLVPIKFYFGAPSCVPATPFESSGAELDANDIDRLLKRDDILYLAEMMNFPGVLHQDKEVMDKINRAKNNNKVIDGHAPGLKGEDAKKYAAAGISTDHECFSLEEARDKIQCGMKILIREGSAAKNFNDLIDLLKEFPEHVMFCSDDKHPDDLIKGHINLLVKKAINKGYDPMDVIRACTYNPVNHYHLHSGLLQPGDDADFIVVDSLQDFNVLETYIIGEKVASHGKSMIDQKQIKPLNVFHAHTIEPKNIEVKAESDNIKIIEAIDGQLITKSNIVKAKKYKQNIISDTEQDVLKLVVLNRYRNIKPAVGFIRNFGLKKGAIASTIAHDCHNIIAVGVTDKEITNAINLIIEHKGGISCYSSQNSKILPLPIGGIMSSDNGDTVAIAYEEIDKLAKAWGCKLKAPFMTLSFMALLVIPELKLSDKGLFDGNQFAFTSIYA